MEHIKIKSLGLDFFAAKIPNFLTAAECTQIAAETEKRGYSDVHTNKFGEKFTDKTFRTDQGLSFIDAKLANDIFARIATYETANFAPTGIHSRLRFSKYLPGSQCAGHQDDPIVVLGKKSTWTILIYLNSDSAGATRLYNPATMKHVDILPKTGMALIFDHRIPHMGLCPKRIKYVMRTDLFEGNAIIQNVATSRYCAQKKCPSGSSTRRFLRPQPGRFVNGKKN